MAVVSELLVVLLLMLLLDDSVCTLFLADESLADELLSELDWLLLEPLFFELIGTVTVVVAGQITTLSV